MGDECVVCRGFTHFAQTGFIGNEPAKLMHKAVGYSLYAVMQHRGRISLSKLTYHNSISDHSESQVDIDIAIARGTLESGTWNLENKHSSRRSVLFRKRNSSYMIDQGGSHHTQQLKVRPCGEMASRLTTKSARLLIRRLQVRPLSRSFFLKSSYIF